MLLRGQLKSIYESLSNEEKKEWAERARYNSYQGLYRYVNAYPENVAYDRVVRALNETIGEQRFNDFTSNISGTTTIANTISNSSDNIQSIIENLKTEVIPEILNSNNIEILEMIQGVLEATSNITKNQIERLNLLNNI